MGRSRYKIHEPTHPHFITCTVLHWIPIFTRTESVKIIIDSLKYFQQNKIKIKGSGIQSSLFFESNFYCLLYL